MIKEKLFDKRIFCCNCDYAYKAETMFIKEYNNTAICLCRKCAKELANEINGRYKKEDDK